MAKPASDFFALATSALKFWTQFGEAAAASGTVLAKRGAILDEAMRNPLGADHAELGRLMPEKLSAFGRSGNALLGDMIAINQLALTQMQDIAAVTLRGRLPKMADYQQIGDRAIAIATLMASAGTRALQPIHATVTANARRLR